MSESRFGPSVWLVYGQISGVEARGRAVQNYPVEYEELKPYGLLTPRSPWKGEYLFPININPRKFLTPSQLDRLREVLPRAVGARVLVSGFLVILFKSLPDVQDAYHHDWVMEVGGLRTIYDIANAEITATSIESGVRLTSSPNSVHSAGCLGLRLPMGNGTGTITLCCAPAGRATAHPKPSSFKTSKSDTSLVRMRTRVGATLRSSKLAFCFQRTLGLQLLFLVMALPPSI